LDRVRHSIAVAQQLVSARSAVRRLARKRSAFRPLPVLVDELLKRRSRMP
jgi:hypothetical protein